MSLFTSRSSRSQWFRIIIACALAVIGTNYIDHHFLFRSGKYKCENPKSDSQPLNNPPRHSQTQASSFVSTVDPFYYLEKVATEPRYKAQFTKWVEKYYSDKGLTPPSGPSQPTKPRVISSAPKIVYDCTDRPWSADHMVWDKSMGFMPANPDLCINKNARESIDHNIDNYFMEDKVDFWKDLNKSPEKVSQLQKKWKKYIDDLQPIETYQSKGFYKQQRGVVYTAHKGSVRRCLKSIRFLRALGSDLPVEVWYLTGELQKEHIAELETETNVKVRDLTDSKNPFPSPPRNESMKRNFQVKSASIINSDFVELLYLDSDNLPMTDPTFLFEIDSYKLTGAILWPDFWKTHYDNPIWNVMGVPCRDEWEVEAGQIVIDKRRNWKPMHLAHYMQSHYEIYFRLLNGDKDTFRFGFLALKEQFFMVPHFLASAGLYLEDRMCGNTMVQTHPIDGSALFAHMNLVKDLESDGMVEARPREFVFKKYVHPLAWDPRLQPEFYATHVGTKDVPCVDLKTAPHVRALIQQGWFVDFAPSQFFDLYDELKT